MSQYGWLPAHQSLVRKQRAGRILQASNVPPRHEQQQLRNRFRNTQKLPIKRSAHLVPYQLHAPIIACGLRVGRHRHHCGRPLRRRLRRQRPVVCEHAGPATPAGGGADGGYACWAAKRLCCGNDLTAKLHQAGGDLAAPQGGVLEVEGREGAARTRAGRRTHEHLGVIGGRFFRLNVLLMPQRGREAMIPSSVWRPMTGI